MDDKKQSIGQGFIILAFSGILVKVLSLVFVPLIRGLLGGDVGYSVYSSAYSVYAFVYVIATAGFPVAISKLISELSGTQHTREALESFKLAKKLLIIIGFVLMAIVMIFCKPIARYMNNEDSWAGILCLAPTVFICSILSAYRGYFQGRKNMRPTALSQFIEQVVHVAISAALVIALKDKGIVWAVAGATIGTAIGSLASLGICLWYYKYDKIYFRRCIEAEEKTREISDFVSKKTLIKRIFYYSMPILVSSAVQYGGDLIDSKTIKGGLAAAGFTEQGAKILHGQYMAMRQLINVPGSLATALCVAVLPAITAALAAKKYNTVNKNTQFSFKLCYLVAVPISFAYAVYSGPIYKLLGYGTNIILLTLSSLSVILLCTIHLQSSIMQAHNMMFTSSIFMCICVVIKVILNYVLVRIPGLNIYGAIISTYCSYIIPFCLNLYVMKKRTSLRFSILSAISPTILASTVAMLISYVVYGVLRLVLRTFIAGYLGYLIAFAPAALVAVVVYYLTLRLSGGLTVDEMEKISPKLPKIAAKADRLFKIQ